jgi:hypothetical protein
VSCCIAENLLLALSDAKRAFPGPYAFVLYVSPRAGRKPTYFRARRKTWTKALSAAISETNPNYRGHIFKSQALLSLE